MNTLTKTSTDKQANRTMFRHMYQKITGNPVAVIIPSKTLMTTSRTTSRTTSGTTAVTAIMMMVAFILTPVSLVYGQSHLTVSDAILATPAVQQQRAQVCQAISRFDQARSSQLPQVDFTVSGGSVASDNFNRSGRLTSPGEEYAIGRRFENKNVDGTFRLTQSLYDGKRAELSKQIADNDRAVAKLLVVVETETAAADIINIGLNYYFQQQLHDHYTEQLANLKEVTGRIYERVELGAGRISDLREARLMELEVEIALSQAERQMDLIERDMIARFKLTPDQILPYTHDFIDVRPDDVQVENSENIRQVKQLEIQIQSLDFEHQRLTGERRPNISAHVDTTLFDIDSFSHEYEVVGRLQMTLPIYDGGSNKARKNENEWRRRGLMSERANLIRSHASQTQRVISDHRQSVEALKEINEQIAEMEERLKSVQAREGQTQSEPLALARLLSELSEAKARYINQTINLELSLLQGVFFADQLSAYIDLPEGEQSC